MAEQVPTKSQEPSQPSATSASAPAPAGAATTPAPVKTEAPKKPAAKKAATKGVKFKYALDKGHVWPHLTRLEMLSAIAAMILLTLWSVLVDAPLEEPSNPARTPNPSKAPWYFLGLQEMLVYFDPWIAGVVLPTMIIIGLMVLPYVDPNPKGNGYYTFKERWFAITTFLFGFLVLWISLIILGTFMRGPGWNIFMPWQEWGPHLVVPLNNVDLNEFLALLPFSLGASPESPFFLSLKATLLNEWVGLVLGLTAVGLFFVMGLRYFSSVLALQERMWRTYWDRRGAMLGLLGICALGGIAVGTAATSVMVVPVIIRNFFIGLVAFIVFLIAGFLYMERARNHETKEIAQRFEKLMGPVRYYTVGFLYVTMMGLVAKMMLRQLFNIKYIVQIQFFGIDANI